jgi:hypothetical protein
MIQMTPEQIERERREDAARREHARWMEEAADKIPALAARVFALRGTGYLGSGFGWSLEARLGRVITMATDAEGDVWYGPKAMMNRTVARMALRRLIADIERAEATRSVLPATTEPDA